MENYTRQQLVECYLKHKSAPKVSKELGISLYKVYKAAHDLGVALDGRKYNSGGPRGQRTARHGTRTMYTHYGCRCEACCKAEHQQYLKRKETQQRRRTNSKWGDGEYNPSLSKSESQRRSDANRYKALTKDGHAYRNRIRWYDIAEQFNMTCAICGCKVDPTDTWTNKNGCICFGRKYPTVDHIIPLKYGGTDTLDNVQLACKRCNSAKGARAW